MDWLNETLKQYVSEDKMEAVMADIKKVFPEHAVPKEQYNKKVEALEVASSELETTKTQMEEVNNKLGEIGSSAEELESAKATIAELQETHTSFVSEAEKRESNLKLGFEKNNALERLLLNEKADTTQLDWLKNEFKLDEMTLNADGGFDGFADMIASVKEKRPNSFVVEKTIDPVGEPVVANPSNENVSSFRAGLNAGK
jgi:chromosome segregation ATPase